MLDGFERVDVSHCEHRLDLVLAKALEMLDVKFGIRLGDHVLIRGLHSGIGKMRTLNIVGRRQVQDIHLRGPDDDRDLVRFGVKLSQHVARVVAQPLRLLVVIRGSE